MTSSVFVIVLTTLMYSVLHSLLATLGVKKWVADTAPAFYKRWYRFAYNIFAGASFLPVLWLVWKLPDKQLYTIPSSWAILTYFGQLLGVMIIYVGIQHTNGGEFLGTTQALGREVGTSEMITTGFYKYMRHPLYTGGLLIIWLMPYMSVNMLTLFITLTIYLIIGARLEERRLLLEFGEKYEEYIKQVPMLIPLPKKSFKVE